MICTRCESEQREPRESLRALPTKVSKTNNPERLGTEWSDSHTRLEKEALRNDWTIETNREGRKTAIDRMDHTTGAAKIRKINDIKWMERPN